MSTIHFRIGEEMKRLATQAAERQKVSLTELLRQRVEELAENERGHQSNAHEYWLEQQVEYAFEHYESGQSEYLSNEEMRAGMEKLKLLAMQGKLRHQSCNGQHKLRQFENPSKSISTVKPEWSLPTACMKSLSQWRCC